MMNILRTVTLDRINRKKDKSVSLTFITTTEQTSEQFMELDKELDQSGLIYFKTSGTLTTEEIKALDKSELAVEGKTKSQRLRSVMFLHYEQNCKKDDEIGDFNGYYSHEMEKIIEHYKGKLK